jgi:hypothetical protein
MEDSAERTRSNWRSAGAAAGSVFVVPGIEATETENLSMVKSQDSASQLRFSTDSLCRNVSSTRAFAFCWLLLLFAVGQFAAAQGTSEFTLDAGSLDPVAVAPGGTSSSTITVGSVNSFRGSVALSCQVTSNQTIITSPPVCTVSPTSVTPPATATATITTTTQTTPVAYSITVTGTTATPTTFTTPAQGLTVLAVTPQFTITVESAVAPNSVPAGNGAEGIISVNPVNGYSSPAGGITLYCSSITPLVTIPPVCSFNPSGNTLRISGGTAASSTLTISTFGPVPTGALVRPQKFYALWMPLPLLGFLGIGAALHKRSRHLCGLLAILVVSGSMLLMPACSGTNTTSTSTPNGVTPANSYSFAIVGIDSDGVVSSNTGTNSTATTVSLTVTAPAAH